MSDRQNCMELCGDVVDAYKSFWDFVSTTRTEVAYAEVA